ncbi:NAD(P)H-dependent oxidoreductase [Poseidonibacter lekithochrous]|uniref:NAD(P)H-dependent oxidoreductase n=1 Tax=Poseidonibacter lekithochrous TaxID=1904463 RepID=UPI000D339718|nr:NAD(P)H-dependent oxidoreductase [Poseidonibacter lekithochrous]
MNKTFEEAMNFRHACKEFDKSRKIPKDDIEFVLNAGIQSPTSYGLEFTKYLVIENNELKSRIQNASMNQEQVSQCSHLVVVLVRIDDAKIKSGTPKQRFERLNLPDETLNFFLDMYGQFSQTHLKDDKDIYHWTSKQAYISIGNMMTAAAVKGIDSCPLEGFEKDKIEEILELNNSSFQVALVLPLGYRNREPRDSIRLDYKEVVEFIS